MALKAGKKRDVVSENADFLMRHFLAKTKSGVKKHFTSKLGRLNFKSSEVALLLKGNTWNERLKAFALLEQNGAAAPERIASALEKTLLEPAGRRELSLAAEHNLPIWPDSAILLYIRILGLCDEHRFADAHQLIDAALIRQCMAMQLQKPDVDRIRNQVKRLSALWKIVDSSARDQMQWVVGPVVNRQAYNDLDFLRAFENLPQHTRPKDYEITLAFAEPYLQGKQNAKYLAACKTAFEEATTTFQRLRAIRAMWRQGFRRIPEYTLGYEQARVCYAKLRPEISHLIDLVAIYPLREMIRLLCSAYAASVHLDLVEDARLLREALLNCSVVKGRAASIWIVANILSNENLEDTLVGNTLLSNPPVGSRDHRDFFQWAARRARYDYAHKVFGSLPDTKRKGQQLLSYVNILQREQRFEEATELVNNIHSDMLATPSELDFFASFGLIRRAGELSFAAQTARYYSSVPQPSNPKGIIFATPRNIEQLRRTPIVVLMEWKRQGWAVVPLHEGVLPLEKTGVPQIDRFAGCIRSANELREDFAQELETHIPVDICVPEKTLRWRDIDLSHAAWEEAAINRRVYNPSWSCPALGRSLGNLGKWTEHLGNVLEFARTEFSHLGLPVGVHVFFNFRLPDAIVRQYCERYGDPKKFFCIHASNGYENYFKNFEQNQSSYMSIRNMTAHPEARTCAFPTEQMVSHELVQHSEEFDDFAKENFERSRLPNGNTRHSPQAAEIQRKITAWRQKGGKVAVAFGKVVCDSGVPYDGGPCHSSMSDWINHTIKCVAGSDTLLLIKPHPHEKREEIATFINEEFRDIIECDLPENVIYLDHDWFEVSALIKFTDLALIYNSTAAIEMASMGVATVLCSYFAPLDYPVGHELPMDQDDYRKLVRFERRISPRKDVKKRAASWLNIMRSGEVAIPYRYHTRQITNKVVYPPKWFTEEIENYLKFGDPNVSRLAQMIVGE